MSYYDEALRQLRALPDSVSFAERVRVAGQYMEHHASVREKIYGEPRRRYQAFCPCGWLGRVRTIRHAALIDAAEHES